MLIQRDVHHQADAARKIENKGKQKAKKIQKNPDKFLLTGHRLGVEPVAT